MSNTARIREKALLLNPIDDLMFRKMAENMGFCEEILQVILEDPDLTVLEAIPQWQGTNMQGRSVILDAKCKLGAGTEVNIEVQKPDDDNHQKRVRYNGAILTTNLTDPKTKFKDIPDVCVVFISKSDFFKRNHAVYHVDRILRETGELVENGFTEVYVNAAVKDSSRASRLMTVFTDSDAYSEEFPETSAQKSIYKKTEGGIQAMCDVVKDLAKEERAKGREETSFVMKRLLSAGRIEDAKRAADDSKYMDQLLEEFGRKEPVH